jgi:hypothetical protein
VSTDRAQAAWGALQSAQDPMGLYARMYRGKVVAQSDDADLVDVRPDDPRLPDMAKLPLRHGIPGLRVSVAMGSYLLVGWDDGRPDKAFAALWNRDVKVRKVSLVADEIHLGSRGASEALILGTSYRAAEDQLLSGLQQAFAMLAGAASAGPLAALQPGMQQAIAALTKFIAQASAARGYLSPKVTGE